ncbi:hypothetical protein IAU59_007326 [Kwoniella sp. CBS 9459]
MGESQEAGLISGDGIASRAYRAGLGLPPAVIIRSDPGPSPARYRRLYQYHEDPSNGEDDDDYDHDNDHSNFEAGPSRPPQPTVYELSHTIPPEAVWREWNINPASHGPVKLTRPPTFVASSNVYDELGRTVDDGVGVVVEKGKSREKRDQEEEGKVDGEGVRGWYLALSRGGSGSGHHTPKNGDQENSGIGAGAQSSKVGGHGSATRRCLIEGIATKGTTLAVSRSNPGDTVAIIDLTGDDDDDDKEDEGEKMKQENIGRDRAHESITPGLYIDVPPIPNSQSATSEPTPSLLPGPAGNHTEPRHTESTPSSISAPSTEHTQIPLRVHSNEWFIRRALLRRSQAQNQHQSPDHNQSASADTFANGRPQPKSLSSIGDMLSMPPSSASKTRVLEPKYALGPENKGYSLLKDRLGWEGGGLGRPVGWAHEGGSSTRENEGGARDDQSDQAGLHYRDEEDSRYDQVKTDQGGSAFSAPVELDRNGQAVVDLTLSDAESEPGSGQDVDFNIDLDIDDQDPDPSQWGPGRTAPISTTLKLDRLGLGHRRSQVKANSNRPTSSKSSPSSRAPKITHTLKDIQDAQRRAKYGKGRDHGAGIELGKKGKIKWKERDKREREERSRLAAALNA